MKIKGYIISAAALILVVYLAYFINFYVVLGYRVSTDSAVWGQLGDYVGGILNPLLSFVSIVLLIKSLTLQHEANRNLKVEIKNNEKTEKLRSFEVLFFNLISSQKNIFDSFELDFENECGAPCHLAGIKAVLEIENRIEAIRNSGGEDQEIKDYLKAMDENDQIFGLSRAFYIIVMIITEKLDDAEGFSSKDRRVHFKALVNLTDFAQLRLVMICVQFLDYESAKYLRSSYEFKDIVEELGLNYELY